MRTSAGSELRTDALRTELGGIAHEIKVDIPGVAGIGLRGTCIQSHPGHLSWLISWLPVRADSLCMVGTFTPELKIFPGGPRLQVGNASRWANVSLPFQAAPGGLPVLQAHPVQPVAPAARSLRRGFLGTSTSQLQFPSTENSVKRLLRENETGTYRRCEAHKDVVM